ncbi:unnamed protein product [Pseudo-nitzschia multistriata]|uniref:CRAL-TRIO domain-containing protein n=1 Tax=Pseudo-nitzschia multistriata TaxID=183589 RepID=A0A448ZGT3_9STRA|nr:unnamed protein product [Pseudo-nitzschia multistriata]
MVNSASSSFLSATDIEAMYAQTPTPTETLSVVEKSMGGFHELLEKDKTKNSNWRLAEENCPEECSDDFKLIFLRCEVFEVELAVKRYIKYWDNRIETFGIDKGFLPIINSDGSPGGAMKDDLEAIDFGYFRMAPPGMCEDPDGRAICFLNASVLDEEFIIGAQGMVRASWYAIHLGLQSESAQRKGIVIIAKAPKRLAKALSKSPGKLLAASIQGAVPVRMAALHILDPPPAVSILTKFVRMVLGKKVKKRIYVHECNSLEKRMEALSKYGICREQLPRAVGGDFDFDEKSWKILAAK